MFIETRTTHTEVLQEMDREVRTYANRVINSVKTLRDHPTFTTKTMVRNEYQQMTGAFDLAARVAGGVDRISDETRAKIADAVKAINSLKAAK